MTCARLLSGNRELKYRISEFICSKYGNIPNMATDEIVLRSHTSYCGTIPKLQSPYFNLEGALSHIQLLPGSSFFFSFSFLYVDFNFNRSVYFMCSATRISHPLPAISFFPSSLYLGHKSAPSSEDPSVHQTLRSKTPALISISAISVHQRGIRSCDFSSSACHLWLLSNVHMHTQPSPPFLTSGPLLFSELQLLSLPLQIS